MDTIVDHTLVGELAGRISGSALVPGDAGYEAGRAVHNGLVDRRPALHLDHNVIRRPLSHTNQRSSI